MSRGLHFSSNAKAENELGYVPTSSIALAIHDAVEEFVARGLAPVLPADFLGRDGGDDFFEPPVATERIPK
jgi:hypothetical protein